MNYAKSEKFQELCNLLYGSCEDIEHQAARYSDLKSLHKKSFDGEQTMFSSPGRIEICGNHTDHNNGKVMCAGISVDTLACVTKMIQTQ